KKRRIRERGWTTLWLEVREGLACTVIERRGGRRAGGAGGRDSHSPGKNRQAGRHRRNSGGENACQLDSPDTPTSAAGTPSTHHGVVSRLVRGHPTAAAAEAAGDPSYGEA
ncbi:unnamed protein product, partial [Ectocarpus sp. 4 AP-2014]